MRSELFIVPRLNDANSRIEDYVIVPKPNSANPYLALSDASLAHLRAVRVETVNEVIAERSKQGSLRPAMPRQPSQRDGTSKGSQAGPKPGTSAGGIDGAQIENCAQNLAVVSPEIAIEFRNFDELGILVGHCILLETSQVSHRALICPSSQSKFLIFRS
jgi:hypothetical protein